MFDLTYDLTEKEKTAIEEEFITCKLSKQAFFRLLNTYIFTLDYSKENPIEISLNKKSNSAFNVFSEPDTIFTLENIDDYCYDFEKYLLLFLFNTTKDILYTLTSITIKNAKQDLDICINIIELSDLEIKISLNIYSLKNLLYSVFNAFCNEDLYIKDENSIKTITAVQLIYKEKNNKKFTFLLSKYDEFKNIIKLLFTSNFGSDSLNCEPPYYPNELSKIQKCNLYYNYKNINSICCNIYLHIKDLSEFKSPNESEEIKLTIE